MDQMQVQVKSDKLIYILIGLIILLSIVIGIFSIFKKTRTISPLPDDASDVRIIFVSPNPEATSSAEPESTPSATPKSSPKATPKTTPVNSPEASASAKPSA